LQAIKDWSLADMQVQDNFNGLKINQLIEVGNDAPAILKAIAEWTLGDLSNQEKFDTLKINQLVSIDEANAPNILLAIKDWTLKDLTNQNKFDNLTLKQVLGEEEVSKSQYFRTIGDTPISGLSTAIEGLNLTELFGNDIFRTITIDGVTYFAYTDLDENGHEVLYRLYDKTENGTIVYYLDDTYQTQVKIEPTHIRHMPTVVDSQGVMHVLYYGDGKYYIDPARTQDSGLTHADVTYYYFTAQNRLYEQRDEATGEILYFADEACTIADDREAEGIWHYMLMNAQGEIETHPTLGDMDSMVENMQHNIRNATLNDLEEDGIVKFADSESNITEYKIKKHIELKVMMQTITFDIGDENSSYKDKTYIGELTVMEMLEYLGDVFAAIDRMEAQTHSI
jgi:hypothetical protein